MAVRRDNQPGSPGLRRIIADLRRRILSGRLAAGARLPAVRELAASYGVAANTVHRGLRELVSAGFLSTHGRLGTRVVDHPPHRCCYGLVLPELPGADGVYATRHWQAKAVAARSLGPHPGRRIEIFHGLSGHPTLPEHQRLLAALAERRLAGLIVPDEERIRGWLVPEKTGLPVIGVSPIAGRPAIGQLRLDLDMFLARALGLLAARGLRRPAVVLDHQALSTVPALTRSAQAYGLALPARRVQCVPVQSPAWADHVLAALFAGAADQAPDALIVANEENIPAVGAALDRLGRSDLPQIHLANLPLAALSVRACVRLGWDHRDYLRQEMDLIDGWHQRRQPIGDNVVPLVEEIAGTASPRS